MKISVITTTYRPWNRLLDQLADLKQQTLQDIEWIVIDDLKEQREFTLESDFRIYHELPLGGVVPSFAPARADNSALVYASGELIWWANDYVRLTPGVLQRHWDLYQEFGPYILIAGQLEPMDGQMPVLPRRGDVPVARNIEEVMGITSTGVIQYSAGRNDSAPLKKLLEVNGLDENFDGDRGGSDVDLCQRLMMAGCRYIIDRSAESMCFEYAHHADSNSKYGWEKQLPRKGYVDDILAARGWKPETIRASYGWNIEEERANLRQTSSTI
jgi:GT2 family glycosyltransferase